MSARKNVNQSRPRALADDGADDTAGAADERVTFVRRSSRPPGNSRASGDTPTSPALAPGVPQAIEHATVIGVAGAVSARVPTGEIPIACRDRSANHGRPGELDMLDRSLEAEFESYRKTIST